MVKLSFVCFVGFFFHLKQTLSDNLQLFQLRRQGEITIYFNVRHKDIYFGVDINKILRISLIGLISLLLS